MADQLVLRRQRSENHWSIRTTRGFFIIQEHDNEALEFFVHGGVYWNEQTVPIRLTHTPTRCSKPSISCSATASQERRAVWAAGVAVPLDITAQLP
jgi:hypothetical protein